MDSQMVRRDPFHLFAPFFAMDRRVRQRFEGTNGDEGNRMILPAMDVAETAEQFTITTDLPGLTKEEVKVTLEKGVLTLSGEKKIDRSEDGKDYHVVERRYGAFHRSVTLPSEVDTESASASFSDGVLTIAVPKKEAAKPRQLEIS